MTPAELLPASTRSVSLVRWTTLTGLASGLVWLVPATSILIGTGNALLAVFPLLLVAGALWSVAQAHFLVGRPADRSDRRRWPAEWTLALGGIGPNVLIGAVVTHLLWPLGAGLAVVAGLAGMALGTGLAQLPAAPALFAVNRRSDAAGWEVLAVVCTGWLGIELGAAFSAALWLLV